jgi:hypothetical protein
MMPEIKKLAQILFLLTSVLVLSTTLGYSATLPDPAEDNVKVHTILQEAVPVTPQVQELTTRIIQEGKKLFISYCWEKKYSTVPMVNDFEKFIQGSEITEYYRDTRPERGYGMTPGIDLEEFMQNAKRSDVVVIFLNDAYLRSWNCMYEFFQVWDANTKKISPKTFIVRHPEFVSLFGRGDAAGPYRESWADMNSSLAKKYPGVPAADKKRILAEMEFATEVEQNITFIINELSRHILADYQQQRSRGFIDIFKLALGGEAEEKKEPAAQMVPAIPPVAQGYEAIYQRFLNGVLVYRPQPGNDAGMIKLPIADLKPNPLEGTFDLSLCGDAGKYLSISTGYRKVIKPKNAKKVEIWLAPRFLIEKELATTASHFNAIIGKWTADAYVGIFWNWGGDNNLSWFDYLVSQDIENLSKNNLYENWAQGASADALGSMGRQIAVVWQGRGGGRDAKSFNLFF